MNKKKNNNNSFTVSQIASVESSRHNTIIAPILMSLMTITALFCAVQIFVLSFGLFENESTTFYEKNSEHFSLLSSGTNNHKFWIIALLGCVLICAAVSLKKNSAKCTVFLLAVYISYFAYNYKAIGNGVTYTANLVLYKIFKAYGQTFDRFYLLPFDDTSNEVFRLYLAVIWLTCFIMAFTAIKRSLPIFFTACIGAYAAVPLVFNVFKGEIYIIVAATICIALFMVKSTDYCNRSTRSYMQSKKKAIRVKGRCASQAAYQQVLTCILCLSIVCGAFSVLYDASKYKRNENVDKFSEDLTDFFESVVNGNIAITLGNKSSSISTGDTTRAADISYTGKTMFKIKSDSSTLNPIYLRSFVASEYNGNRWLDLTDKTYSSYKNMWSILAENSFYPQSMFADFSLLCDPALSRVDLRIENVDINKKVFLASPNLIFSESPDLSKTNVKYDDTYTVSGFYGLDSYAQTIIKNSDRNMRVYTDHVGDDIYDTLYNGNFSFDFDMTSYYSSDGVIEKSVLDEVNEKLYVYSSMEKQYRQFVLENYLSYPDNIGEYFQDVDFYDVSRTYKSFSYYSSYYDESKNLVEDNDHMLYDSNVVDNYYNYVIEYVRNFLHENAEYTLKPGTTPYGSDFVDYFINVNHQGYCVHFATAATLMLRHFGIPTRYVEGYFISVDDMNITDSEGYAFIPDSRAHAWTEVYYPLVGWTVVDFTPSYSDGSVPPENDEWENNSDLNINDFDSDYEDSDSTDSEEEDTDILNSDDAVDSESSDTETGLEETVGSDATSTKPDVESSVSIFFKSLGAILLRILKVFLRIIAVVIIWLAIRLLYRRLLLLRFQSKNKKTSAAAVYRYSLRLLAFIGCKPISGESELEFAKRVSKAKNVVDLSEYTNFTNLVMSIRFGQSDTAKTKMIKYIQSLEENIYLSLSLPKRFVMKYLLFLK